MSYASRFSAGRFRHDPAFVGIFIHRCGSNKFALTRPLHSRALGDFDLATVPSPPEKRAPTFNRAVAQAKSFRRAHPQFKDSPIFACTDDLPRPAP